MKKRPVAHPPTVAVLSLLLGAMLHIVFVLFTLPTHMSSRWLGLLILGVGIGVGASALTLFRRAGTSHKHKEKPERLVIQGPYRFSRNPMYLGMVCLLLGIALTAESLPMLIAPCIFFFVINTKVIPWEEKKLTELFGDSYTTYTQKVRRWL